MQPSELSLTAASDAIRQRRLSPVELVDSVLDRVEQVEPRLGAYVTVAAEQARRSALAAERDAAAGRFRGALHGIPMGLKDLIDVAGLPTTASSRVRDGHRADSDSTVAARLAAAGAVLVGKTHTHEFAYGLTTPQTRNARDGGRVAGGSSGGSAVAVSAGTATFALGTDTGGSIRVPAALNGVVGLKPTYGLVPRHGVTSLSWSLDHVGPLTRTVADAAVVLSVLAGQDPRDPASLPIPARDHGTGAEQPGSTSADLTGVRVGVPRNYYFDRVDPQVETAVRRAIDRLKELGARLVEVEIPMTRYIQATQWGLMVPEATAYHERTLRAMPDLYGADVRILLEAGELMPAGDYLRAQRARTLMRQEWARLLEEVDVVAAPTVPTTAVPADQETVTWSDGTVESVSDAYVRLSAPANITGVPSLSVPVGHDGAGMPIGMQLLGRALGEAMLLRVGHAYELSLPARELQATGGTLKPRIRFSGYNPRMARRQMVRPGGRSARVQASVHTAVRELASEMGRDALTVPLVAQRAGVTPSTIYRRWGDLQELLSDVAVERLRPETAPEEHGDLLSDLTAWAEQFLDEMASPAGRAYIRDALLGDPDGSNAGQCSDYAAEQISVILGRAVERGEAAPDVETVIDRVVAPLMYRILFRPDGLDAAYARHLVTGSDGAGA